MRLYWQQPKAPRVPHDQKILFVEFSSLDKNVWPYGCVETEKYYTFEWAPTYEEILTILEQLLKGDK